MAETDLSGNRNFETDLPLNFQAVMQLLASGESFPVDFDDAWQWIGYSRKSVAKKKLLNNFLEDVDYQVIDSDAEVLHQTVQNSTQQEVQVNLGGRPSEEIRLTIDCFKSFAMMAGTARGRQVRRYFLDCEAELKRRLEQERVIQADLEVDLEQQYRAWQQRHDIRVFLKDYLRPELMDVVVRWAQVHGVNPIKLASTVHDTMNERIQGIKSEEVKRANKLSRKSLIRDHFEAPPLIDYAAINKLAKNAIEDRGVEPIQAVHEACDSYLGLSYAPKPVKIVENLYAQGRRLKAAKKQKQLTQGRQLSFWDHRNEVC